WQPWNSSTRTLGSSTWPARAARPVGRMAGCVVQRVMGRVALRPTDPATEDRHTTTGARLGSPATWPLRVTARCPGATIEHHAAAPCWTRGLPRQVVHAMDQTSPPMADGCTYKRDGSRT